MSSYRVVYIKSVIAEEWIEAESVDEARDIWEAGGVDGDLFFVEDENGDQVFFN